MKFQLVIALTCLIYISSFAQQSIGYCGFKNQANKHFPQNASLSLNGSIGLTSIPIALTFLMQSDSTSQYYEGLEDEIMDSLTSHFTPSGIHLYLVDEPVFIYEDLVYDLIEDNDIELIFPGLKNDRIDIVISNSITFNGSQVCGLAREFPLLVTTRYSCIPSNTISHELGHELDLLHTHETNNGIELVDGTNCKTAGDQICDTPADPNRIDLVDSDCTWRGTYEDPNGFDIDWVDPNGDIYETDVTNLMSYYGSYGCRTTFTHEQSLVMAHRIEQQFGIYGYETPNLLFDIYDQEEICNEGYAITTEVKNFQPNLEYLWDMDNDGVIDHTGSIAQHLFTEYGSYTVKLIIRYADGREYYHSKTCEVIYSNESIIAPFLDDYEEDIIRNYVSTEESSPFYWRLGLQLPDGSKVALDQIHFNENSLLTYKMDISEIDNPVLEFDYNYLTEIQIGGDTLLVEQLDCDGQAIKLFEKWGKDLNTNGEFISIRLNMHKSDDDFTRLRFTTKGDAENYHDFMLDNLQVSESNTTSSLDIHSDDFTLYPNPTNSTITIQSESSISKVEVLDFYGEKIASHYEKNVIDITNLPNGIYLIKIYSEDNWIVKKIIKSN